MQQEAAQQQPAQQQQQTVALGSLATGVSAPEGTPFVHSPVAASEPPIRNMSVSTASTTGSIELPLHRSPSAPHVQEAGADVSAQGNTSTFMGTQVRGPGSCNLRAPCHPAGHAALAAAVATTGRPYCQYVLAVHLQHVIA
jgi:hypothetical protein